MDFECVKEAIKKLYEVEEVTDEQAKEFISVLLDLSDREERVVRLYWGIDDGTKRSVEEIAKEFNVSKDTISEVISGAIKKLRHPLRSRKVLGD